MSDSTGMPPTPQDPEPGTVSLSSWAFMAIIGGGGMLLLCVAGLITVVILLGNQQPPVPGDEPSTPDAAVAVPQPSALTADDAAAEQVVRVELAAMIAQLEAGEFETFLHYHMPIDEYLQFRSRPLQLKDPPQAVQQAIADWLKELQKCDIEFADAGRTAILIAKAETLKAEAPQESGPYGDLEAMDTVGYGDNLMMAIVSGLSDLNNGSYDTFLQKMMPPATLAMMKRDGRDAALIQSLTLDSPLVRAMIDDLNEVTLAEPLMDGNQAEFRIPARPPKFGTLPGDSKAAQRIVRFSLVGGHWRFYDNTQTLRTELTAALKRKPPEIQSERSEFRLLKIGSDWRLEAIPPTIANRSARNR